MLRLPLVFCLLAALLSGCTGMPTRDADNDIARLAEQQFAQGEFRAAAQGFAAAAQAQRSGREAFRLREAEAWREEGDLAAARRAIEGLGPRRLDPQQRLRLTLLQGELALDAGEPADALSRLALDPESIDAEYRARFHYLRARAHETLGRPWEAAGEYARMGLSLPRAERGENAQRIAELLAPLEDAALSGGAAALPVGDPLYPHAGRLLSARGLALPRPYARATRDNDLRPPAEADGYRAWTRIALLLPQQGALAPAAQAVRDGFFSAYLAETRTRPEVRVYDSGEERDTAVAAYRAAIAEGADLVVGPLSREAVAALFEQDGIDTPVLALNRGSETPPPPGSASFALAPEDEGVAAAERMLRRGWTRAIAVSGDDDGAQRSLRAFRERFEQRGGRVLAQISLPETTPDYTALIRQALETAGVRASAAVSGAAIPESVADRGVDGIFLAARATQARLFAPQLRVAGVFEVPILATSQIASSGANPRMDRELDGIEFTESPWLISDLPGLPSHAVLAESLDSARGGSARLFAFGLDAFRLTAQLDRLQADPNARLSGATGELALDGFGQVQRVPAWARYRGGRVVPAVDGALMEDELQVRP